MAPACVPTPAVTPASEDSCRQSLREALRAVPDPRSRFGTQYPLASVLSLFVVATLCGCKNPTQVYQFGKQRPGLLAQLSFRPPVGPKRKADRGRLRAPNEDTIASLLGMVDPQALVAALARWVNALIGSSEEAAVDGKALRGTEDHVLTVFAGRLRLAVWQASVGERENELSALEASLAAVLAEYPGLRLLTGDAMFCQKEIARQIVDPRRHYILQLKAPHLTDLATAADAMRQLSSRPPEATSETEKRGAHAAA